MNECMHEFYLNPVLGFKICKLCSMSEIMASIKPVKPLMLTKDEEQALHRRLREKFGVDFGILSGVPINGECPKGMQRGCNPGVFIQT